MLKLRHSLLTALLCTTLASCAFAQTNLTEILDSITNPDGAPFNGTVLITWNGSAGSSSGPVSGVSASVHVYNGALSVLLVPTTTAASGTYYQVVYNSSDGTVTWTEIWQVPPSTTPLTVAQVRQSSGGTSGGTGGTGTGGGQFATLPISINEVTSLSADLSAINSSITSLTSQINTLSTTVSGHSTALTNLTATVSGLSTTVTGNTSSIAGLSTSVSSLSTTVAGNVSSLATLSTTVGNLNTTVTNLSNTVSGLIATINSLSPSGSNAVFVDAEDPAGTINGTNAAFMLAHAPAPSGSLTLYLNGLEQTNGVDFTLSGAAITFDAASVPEVGDVLEAYYRIAGTGASVTFADSEVPVGTINGTNMTFTVLAAPSPSASLKLYKNGVLLTQNADYTLSGSTITFASSSSTPQTGDALTASYRH